MDSVVGKKERGHGSRGLTRINKDKALRYNRNNYWRIYEVYNELGHGFLESVYEQAMVIALSEAGLQVVVLQPITVQFRGQIVGEFRVDLVVNDLIIIELKAARSIEGAFEAQVMNYLRATKMEIGLLMNFGPEPEFKRFIYDNDRKNERPMTSHGPQGSNE